MSSNNIVSFGSFLKNRENKPKNGKPSIDGGNNVIKFNTAKSYEEEFEALGQKNADELHDHIKMGHFDDTFKNPKEQARLAALGLEPDGRNIKMKTGMNGQKPYQRAIRIYLMNSGGAYLSHETEHFDINHKPHALAKELSYKHAESLNNLFKRHSKTDGFDPHKAQAAYIKPYEKLVYQYMRYSSA